MEYDGIVEALKRTLDKIKPEDPAYMVWRFKDVAEHLGYKESTVKQIYHSLRVPYKKLGKFILFKPLSPLECSLLKRKITSIRS